MWSDADFSGVGGGGGFDNFGSQTPSAAPAADNKSKRHSSIVPVAIKQITDCPDDSLQIGGLPVSMMQVVGIIKSINITSTKINYKVQDWSGEIDAMLWLEGDNDSKGSNVTENMYAKLTGTLRRNDNNKVLFLYNIEAIENMQQLTYHYLQIIYMPLKAEEQNQIKMPENGVTMSMNNQNGMNLLPQQAKVYQAIQMARTDAGIERGEILSTVKIPPNELDKIIEFLIDEGHIYATIDDFHYRATDA